ncbi:hypothetical protein PR048_001578 [Dryococelus australis]|uniref:Uncharacterized protein n=1 Tax=Dryococelus australis TaxID=614101 RepID=A0ABQ9IHR3_9NEOP|nr:hypothetical protein PR048_001578 [Dryococelus australis]
MQSEETTIDITGGLAERSIIRHFNPPYSRHFDGIWEAAMKAAKTHSKRVVCDLALTFEEHSKLFVQVEANLNSRPLCTLSGHP